MKDETAILNAILHRLNVLIALQLEAVPHVENSFIAVRIRRLAELGLSPGEIGAIVGKRANYVSAVIGSRKKRGNE